MRPNVSIGRMGGEEFAIVLPDADRPSALAIAERIRSICADTVIVVEGYRIQYTVSAGVITDDTHDYSFEMLLARADRNLYAAKRDGRNRVIATDQAGRARHIAELDTAAAGAP